MAWTLRRLLIFILFFHFSDTTQFGNNTGYVSSVCREDEQNCFCPSFGNNVGNLVNEPGLRTRPGDPNRPSKIYSEAFVEASFAPGRRVLKSLSADGLIDSAPADDSAWPSFAAIRNFFHQTLERFYAYVGELVSCLPEEVQPITKLHEWNCRILTIIATVEAVLIIGSVFVLRCIAKSAFIHTEEERDQVNKKLIEQKQTRAAEGKVMVLLRELMVYEREWAYQEILFKEIMNNLEIIDSKYKEREASLSRKQVKKHEDTKRMPAWEGLKVCKKKKEKNEKSLLKVTFQDESLSYSERQETKDIRSLLDEVKIRLVKMRGPIFDCSAGCSNSQFPSPGTDTCSTQTL